VTSKNAESLDEPLKRAPGVNARSLGLDRKWWVLIAIGVGSFMTALDGSVANTILPVLSQAFNSEVAAVEWVVTVFLLVVSGLLLSFGRLGDIQGHKRIYVAGFVVFVLASALAGLSPSVEALVACRALQALGGATILANAPAILTKSFPANERGRALGMQATLTYLGLTVGPSLGGWLTTQLSWRAVFYINVPVGATAIALSLLFIRDGATAETRERFDLAGALVFMVGLVALLLGLNQGHAWGWGSPPIVGSVGAAVLLLALFIIIESRVVSPMLDLSLFRRRLFSAATVSAVMNYICLYSVIFLLPFYLIQGRGLTPAQAGLVLTVQPVIMAIAAPLSGTLSDRIGSRLPGTMGMSVLAVGIWLLSRLGPDAPMMNVALGLGLAGLGTGIFVSPNNSALLGSAPLNRRGIAAGVLATARNVGMVLGVGLAGAILTTVMAEHGGNGTPAGLFEGVSSALRVAAGVAALGAVASAIRGS
jgi:EmrB/QacA subfamily drug resistance transporter